MFIKPFIRPIIIILAFILGFYYNNNETLPSHVLPNLKNKIYQDLEFSIQNILTLTKIHPTFFLQPAIHPGNGVTINKTKNNKDFILISSFYDGNNEIRLINRNNEIIARWPLKFSSIFNKSEITGLYPETDWNTDTHGSLILPNGSIVFNFEYYGLVKLDKCGRIIWKVARQTHHSVEVSETGGFWVPSRITVPENSPTPYPPFQPPFNVDTILKISPKGEIIKEISVPELFYSNKLSALLTATGSAFKSNSVWDREIVHVNKATELSTVLADDFPLFNKGDLAISIRGINLIMVIDPEQLLIKWWHIGPWLRQHDPEFKKGGKISIFNNNIFRTVFNSIDYKTNANIQRVSNIIEIDPVTNTYKIVYGGNKDQEMLSIIRGKHDITPDGGLFITEFEGGRIFETNKNGEIIWEYINRYDENEVAEITEARLYPQEYFTVKDWSCNGANN